MSGAGGESPTGTGNDHVGVVLGGYHPVPEFFAGQLASIAAQAHANWTCWVRMDSSLEPLAEHPALRPFLGDPRFVWAENPERLGVRDNYSRLMADALDAGVAYIAFADQDDAWAPDKLSRSLDLLRRCPPLSMVHCDLLLGGFGDDEPEPETVWQREQRGVELVELGHLVIRNAANGGACVVDADLVRRYPNVPERAPFPDYWYAALAAAHGGLHPLRRPLMSYRVHAGNMVGSAEHPGLTGVASGLGIRDACRKARAEWRSAAALRDALAREGVRLPLRWLPWLGRFPDLGVGLAVAAMRYRRKDPKLARACLKKALGRLFSPCR